MGCIALKPCPREPGLRPRRSGFRSHSYAERTSTDRFRGRTTPPPTTGTIRVDRQGLPSSTLIFLDDQMMSGSTFTVSPGRHTLRANALNFEDDDTVVTVQAGAVAETLAADPGRDRGAATRAARYAKQRSRTTSERTQSDGAAAGSQRVRASDQRHAPGAGVGRQPLRSLRAEPLIGFAADRDRAGVGRCQE